MYVINNDEKLKLCDELLSILINHTGEDGDNEGAVDCLNRLVKKSKKYNRPKVILTPSIKDTRLEDYFKTWYKICLEDDSYESKIRIDTIRTITDHLGIEMEIDVK